MPVVYSLLKSHNTQATFKQETGQPTQLFFQLRTRWTIIYDAACRRPLITTASIPARDSFMRLMRRHQTCRRLSIDEAVLVTLLKNTHLKHGERKLHVSLIAFGSECSRERKYQGAKVPLMVLSLLGAKVRGNESSSYLMTVTTDES